MPDINYVLKGKYNGKKNENRSILYVSRAQINGTDDPISKFTISTYTVIDESKK